MRLAVIGMFICSRALWTIHALHYPSYVIRGAIATHSLVLVTGAKLDVESRLRK